MNEPDVTGGGAAPADIVQTRFFTFGAEPGGGLRLDCGRTLGPITIAYETYGTLNSDRSNAVLVLHALSGDAHAAFRHSPDDRKAGWWDIMIGPGKAIDTQKYFVICSNILGGCKGSTGPSTVNPETGRPFGMDFPIITVSDMVRCQKRLVDSLGISRLLCAIGGSLGGMQALEWSVAYPDSVRAVIPISTTGSFSAQSIAFNEVARRAIMSDPNWNGGNYCDGPAPDKGLAIARMIGHITYLSDEALGSKFGRNLQDKAMYSYDFMTEFQVESYLHYQGLSFTQRFDANTYLYITKAMDYFDLASRDGSLAKTMARARAEFLIVSFSTDWLFPPYQSKEIVRALRANDIECSYCQITSPYGHDAFLLEKENLSHLVSHYINSVSMEA